MTEIKLTEEQQAAVNQLQGWIDEATASGPYFGKMMLLSGYAGTGKSTCVWQLIQQNLKVDTSNPYKSNIVVTAPTNKAVKVLQEKAAESGLTSVPCLTIYKLLGVKPGNDDEKRTLKKDGKSTASEYRIVVIDECSMLNSSVMDFIQKELSHHIVIFMGDPMQLPPVGETNSNSFNIRSGVTLSKVMRQADQNPILAMTAEIRRQIAEYDTNGVEPDWGAFRASQGDDGGIFEAGRDLEAWLRDAFTGDDFRKDNDAFRYLAWRNATVNRVNAFVREMIYGRDAPRFVVGERLLLRKPAMRKTVSPKTGEPYMETLFSTDTEVTVKSISVSDGVPGVKLSEGISAWQLYVADDEDRHGNIYILHDDGKAAFAERSDLLKKKAKDYETAKTAMTDVQRATLTPRSLWPEFFQFSEAFTDVQPVYAMTVHRSQGSTFGSVFVDIADLRINRNIAECLRLLYVAASRPRHFLVI